MGDVLGVLLELLPDDAALPDAPKKRATKGGGGGNGGGRISYFLNGKPLGVAFEWLPSSLDSRAGDADAPPTLLRYYPALSLDEGEALRVNIGTRPFAFPECVPAGAKPVAEAMTATTTPAADDDEPQQNAALAAVDKALPQLPQQQKQAEEGGKSKASASNSSSNSSGGNGNGKGGGGTSESKAPPPPKRDVAPEALDLGRFTAAEELEALGLDRLKAALMALGVKCGGSLQERAARLWSLKGVPAEEIDPKLRVKQKK